MANKPYLPFSEMGESELIHELEQIKTNYEVGRKQWERMWYDNNFFDDGYHYMFVSPDTGVVVDYGANGNPFEPRRAIPKTSRQIRGIGNLLLANRPTPVIYPYKLIKDNFSDEEIYEQARKLASTIARRTGQWVTCEWAEQLIMQSKLPLMMLLTAKHSVSYLKMWGDSVEEKLMSQVRDAFDILLDGTLSDIEDNPVIIETAPVLISKILNNEDYDRAAVAKLQPDNKYSDSEVKQAYLKTKFGAKQATANTGTLQVKENIIKDYLTKSIAKQISQQDDGELILRSRGEGDPIYRQITIAGKEILADKYVNLRHYPYIPLQFEPGPLYSTPFMERFKGANKVLDNVVSRVEGYAHIMVAGKWWRRTGENWKVNNENGQVIESTTRPEQLPMATVPAFMFNFIQLLVSFIEEQGMKVSTGGGLPNGVEAWKAIESLKESEYANLTIPLEQTKLTVKQIAERMLDISHDYFVTPQVVEVLEKGEPDYFEIIGQRGLEVNKDLLGDTKAIPLNRKYKVSIEIESGLGYTMEGKRAAAKSVADYMLQLAEAGLVPSSVMSEVVKRILQTYQFGGTAEILEAIDNWDGDQQMTEDQITKIKIAVAEVLKDMGIVGPEADQRLVDSTKVGVVEALKDTGMLDEQGEGQDPKEQVEVAAKVQDMKLKQQEHQMKMQQMDETMEMKKMQMMQAMELKEKMAAQAKKQPAKKSK